MNTKLVAKVGIVLFIFGITICVGYGVVAAFRLSEKNDQEYLQKYRNDFKEVKAGGMDVLDEYSKISTLHTAIKSGFVKSAEIGANDVEVTFLYVLSKERARKELEKRMKDHPEDSESFKVYKWLLENLDK